ncbi:MAG TPA: RusA family crossover junction endodeoxyribonuclease [Longimicrobium sp.]|nr:RusA family crossover junction endodeoxyribonuclease [Longimicrobium sp.]
MPIPIFRPIRLVLRFEFVVPGRPASVHSSDRGKYQAWKRLVRSHAELMYPVPPAGIRVRLTVVFLCGRGNMDVDNLIKPIQDALTGWAYRDDAQVTDVDGHRRSFRERADFDRLPPLLKQAWLAGGECVYVRGEEARALEVYL